MTNQEKKAYLMQYLRCEEDVQDIIEEMARIRSEEMRITPLLSKVPRSGSNNLNNKLQAAVEKLEKKADEMNRALDEREKVKRKVRAVIATVDDKRLERLLCLRYISGLTWDRVADRLELDNRWVRRLHGNALSKLTLESPPKKLI